MNVRECALFHLPHIPIQKQNKTPPPPTSTTKKDIFNSLFLRSLNYILYFYAFFSQTLLHRECNPGWEMVHWFSLSLLFPSFFSSSPLLPSSLPLFFFFLLGDIWTILSSVPYLTWFFLGVEEVVLLLLYYIILYFFGFNFDLIFVIII